MFDINVFTEKVLNLVQERDDAYRKNCDDICNHCKNKIECKQKECDQYVSGDEGYIDNKLVKFKWDCMDFDYGSCSKMENTPCYKCFENEYSGFVYNGDDYDYKNALDQIKSLVENGKSAIDSNMRLSQVVLDLKEKLDNAGIPYD